jgi:hypothetical protein
LYAVRHLCVHGFPIPTWDSRLKKGGLAVHEFSAERHFPPRRQPSKFLCDSARRDLAMQPLAISNVGQSIIESFRGFIQEFDLFGAQLVVATFCSRMIFPASSKTQ